MYDTRFNVAIYDPREDDEAARLRRELSTNLRTELLKRDFTMANLDWKIAKEAALLWKKYRVPMADAVIAATALQLKASCVTNDPHFAKIKELHTRWV